MKTDAMSNEIDLHQRENSENTESFLQENINDFKRDLDFVLMLMRNGKRLTAKSLVQEYGIADRRLRDAYLNRESIEKKSGEKVMREWKLNEKGKRMYVEYFILNPFPPTKHEVIERSAKVISIMQSLPDKELVKLFELPDEPIIKPNLQQGDLFQ